MAKITHSNSEPLRMDTDGWRRILVLIDYGDLSNDIRKAYKENIACLIKKIRIKEIDDSSLSPLMTSRLVTLTKNPDLLSIGVKELLQ